MKIKSCLAAGFVVICLLAVYGCHGRPSESKTIEVLPSKHFFRADAYDGVVVKIGTKIRINAESLVPEDKKDVNISYSFMFKPSSSNAVLSDTDSYSPSFVVDVPGEYIVEALFNSGTGEEKSFFEIASQDFYPVSVSDPVRIPPDIQPEKTIPDKVMAGQDIPSLELRFVINRKIKPGQKLLMNFNPLKAALLKKPRFSAKALVNNEPIQLKQAKGYQIEFVVPAEGLSAGSMLNVYLTSRGKGGLTIAKEAHDKFIIYLYISENDQPSRPKTRYRLVPFSTLRNSKVVGASIIKVTASHLDHINVLAPSFVVPGKPFTVLVRPEGRYNYLSDYKIGNIIVQGDDGTVETSCEPVPKSTACTFFQVIKKDGIYRIKVKDKASGLSDISNPIVSGNGPDAKQHYWGVLHGHTVMSYDGIGSLEHYYRQMRDEALLDFGASSDHPNLLTYPKSFWDETKKLVNQLNKPGKFVTFLGYEWDDWTSDGDGDKCVYYLDDDRPVYNPARYFNTNQLLRALSENREKALVIPHHSAMKHSFNDWTQYDPQYERLVEIYQVRGSFECGGDCAGPYRTSEDKLNPIGYVQNALKMGWRVGFTGGGDDHLGAAGINVRGNPLAKDGLMSIRADSLTHKALWDGMWNRRVVATTGERILLDYWVNSHLFGSELSLAKHPELARARKIKVEVHGTAPLRTVEIIRNNKVVFSKSLDQEKDVLDLEFSWEDRSPLSAIAFSPTKVSPDPFVYYYVRVRQYNDEMAWASPLWVDLDTKVQ